MMQADPSAGPSPRRGATSPVVVLPAGILIALVVLIVVLLTQRGGGAPPSGSTGPQSGPVIADGQVVRLPEPRKRPKPIDDPDRIKEALQPGKTYTAVLEAVLMARAEGQAWGLRQVVHLAYVAEMQVDRTIESNDDKRVVELRRFVRSRNAKLLCDVEDVTINLGAPGVLLLAALDSLLPGTTAVVTAATPIAEGVLRYGSQEAARAEAARAVAHVDSLSGKAVRIVYVDGLGVQSIEPVGCTLSQQEEDFVAGTAVLSDCYIWDLKKRPGEHWTVDGAQLAGLVDPSLRGATSGEIELARDPDGREDGRPYAALRVGGGTLTVDTSDASARRIGSFTPEGTLRYSFTDKVVERATLVGRFTVDEVSTDHLLFEARFRSRPTMTVEYACSVR